MQPCKLSPYELQYPLDSPDWRGRLHRYLTMGLRLANRPLVDNEGYATAIVTRSEFGHGTQTVKASRDDIDVRNYERYELDLAVDGTAGVIPMSVYAGVNLNGDYETQGRGKTAKRVYNRLTAICLGLGIVKPEELEGVVDLALVDRVQADLLKLEGAKVKFRLGKVEGRNLAVPVPDTIRRVD